MQGKIILVLNEKTLKIEQDTLSHFKNIPDNCSTTEWIDNQYTLSRAPSDH